MNQQSERFNGVWQVGQIPDDFVKVLKILGYSTLERKWFKNTRTLIKSTYNDTNNLLILEIIGRAYNKIKEYRINELPIEYNDDSGNPIIEISRWINQNTIEIKSIFLIQNVTIIDTREILENGDCRHHVTLLHGDEDHPLDVEMILAKKHQQNKLTVDIEDDKEDDNDLKILN